MDKQSQMAKRSAMRPNYSLFPAKLCFKSQQYSIPQREVSHEECRAPKDGLLPITGE
jgi:hypothetical protein